MKIIYLQIFINLVASFACADDLATQKGLRGLQASDVPIYPIRGDTGAVDPLFQSLSIPADAAQIGMWSPVRSLPLVAVHTSVLPNGKVIMYGAPPGGRVQGGRIFVVWDTSKGFDASAFTTSANPEAVDSFCSSATYLTNGEYLVSGGGGPNNSGTSRESSIFNFRTQSARRVENLNSPRWYGTMTALPDGRQMISGGCVPYVTSGFTNPAGFAAQVSSTPEVYTQGQGWQTLSGARSLDAFGAENNRYWYPRQWVSPVGTVFGISTDKYWEMTLQGSGSIRTLGTFKTKPDEGTLPNVGPTSTATMYDTGKIIQVGGNGYNNGYASRSSNQATVFYINALNTGTVRITATANMNFPRQWANAAVLPNGRVLVTGGTRFADSAGENAVLASEIWNPTTGQWTIGASAAVYRGYHSSTALLPNGVVVSAGGGIPGPVDNLNAEIYYPPYLFRAESGRSVLATKPRIVSISSNALGYRVNFNVQTNQGTTVSEVSLIAVPVVTHSFDSNQRRMKLAFTVTTSGITVTTPANGNLAPPGYYYLSVVNQAGVPSNAIIIALAATAPPTPVPVPVPVASPVTTPVAPPVAPPVASPVAPLPTAPVGFVIPEITGPFQATVVGRYDNVNGFYWQRLFDFGNGPELDCVFLGQRENTNDMIFEIWRDRRMYRTTAPGAIINGETATWRVGVDANALMWIEKNGRRLVQQTGIIPANVIRVNKFIGKSNWPADAPLRGAVTSISVSNVGYPEITGPFEATAIGRFDNVNGFYWQRLFDFGNGPELDCVLLGQRENTNDMLFEVWRDRRRYRIVAPGAIINGETATWRVGVDANALMWIEKNGRRLIQQTGIVPANVIRVNKFVGKSNWPADAPLRGSVDRLTITNK
jgi:galactose oxidase